MAICSIVKILHDLSSNRCKPGWFLSFILFCPVRKDQQRFKNKNFFGNFKYNSRKIKIFLYTSEQNYFRRMSEARKFY